MKKTQTPKQRAAVAKMQRGLARWRKENGKPVAKKKRSAKKQTKRPRATRRRAGYAPSPVIILVEE
jgi:hypothetical protein